MEMLHGGAAFLKQAALQLYATFRPLSHMNILIEHDVTYASRHLTKTARIVSTSQITMQVTL